MSSPGVYPKPRKPIKARAAPEIVQASRVRHRKEADFQNMAIEHELKHTLRTYDSMKTKAVQGLDFEQRKFLLSRSTEHLPTHAHYHDPLSAHVQRPATSLDVPRGLKQNERDLKQDLRRTSSNVDLNRRQEVVKEGPEYSISSNMKLADTKAIWFDSQVKKTATFRL